MSIWDHKLKKRLRLYPAYHSAVPSIDFNCDGTKLAVGVSYNWDEGEEGSRTANRPSVYIRTVGDEVKVGSFNTHMPSICFSHIPVSSRKAGQEVEGMRFSLLYFFDTSILVFPPLYKLLQ